MIYMSTKICTKCGENKDISQFYFYKTLTRKGKPFPYCIDCGKLRTKNWTLKNPGHSAKRSHISGMSLPMNKNRTCPKYLGEVVAEGLLSAIFEHVEKAPMNNPGWDFRCGKRKLIDCKSACLHQGSHDSNQSWYFNIRKNQICDYFLLLVFDNRNDLYPLHVWLIPGDIINNKMGLQITNSSKSLAKWNEYEKPIDKVIGCCNILRTLAPIGAKVKD